MPSFLRLAESHLQLIARVIVILPSSVSRAAWSSDGTAMVSPRCSGWSHAPCGALDDGAHETVNDWQMYSGGALSPCGTPKHKGRTHGEEDGLTPLVLSTMANNSLCSASGTLNFAIVSSCRRPAHRILSRSFPGPPHEASVYRDQQAQGLC